MTAVATESLRIPRQSPALRETLERGTVQEQGRTRLALPRAVEGDEVVFDLVEESAVGRPAGLGAWMVAIRAISLTATATPCLATLLYGVGRDQPVDVPLAVLALVGALLLQVSVNVLNDVEDHLKLIDLPGRLGGSGVIQKGWLSAGAMRRAGLIALALGGLCGVPALIKAPQILIGVALTAVIAVVGYSGWPFRFKYRALGDVAVFLCCGPVLTIGYALAAFGTVDLGVVLLGSFFGLAAMGILHANNLEDVGVDQASGAVTVASAMGFGPARAGLLALYVAAYAVLLAGAAMGHFPWAGAIAPLLAAPVALKVSSKALKAATPEAIPGLRFEAAQTHLMLGIATCIGLGVAIAL